MQAKKEYCYPCLERLTRKTADLACRDRGFSGEELADKGLSYLSEVFSEQSVPTYMAGDIQRILRKEADCRDPFAEVKQKEMELARQFAGEFPLSPSAGMLEMLKYAAKGNSIDFFVPMDKLREEVKKPVSFSRDDTGFFMETLEQMKQSNGTKKILYLADNAGECYFDLPLAKKLEDYGELYYVVKESPVQNDLTLDDLQNSGIKEEFGIVASSGTDTPGLDLRLASPEFMELFNEADLIVAKGMGHYETLTEVKLPAPTLLLMKAKCEPIAMSVGVELNGYTAMRLCGYGKRNS